jgi:thiol-disulfide isomerase/thioredoxin
MKKTILIASAVLFFYACGKNKENQPNAEINSESQNNVQSEYKKNEYYFKLPGIEKEIDLKDYANKPVLVMFFTENCPYCRKATPFIKSVYEKYKGKIEVIGITLGTSLETLKDYKKEFNIEFDLAYKGKVHAAKYHVQGVPTIILLNKKHDPYNNWIGYDESYKEDINKNIEEVIKEK